MQDYGDNHCDRAVSKGMNLTTKAEFVCPDLNSNFQSSYLQLRLYQYQSVVCPPHTTQVHQLFPSLSQGLTRRTGFAASTDPSVPGDHMRIQGSGLLACLQPEPSAYQNASLTIELILHSICVCICKSVCLTATG